MHNLVLAKAAGLTALFPVVRESIGGGATYGLKSGLIRTTNTLGMKAAGFWANNANRNLENHQAIIVLTDPETGQPTMVCDGNEVTRMRTAAICAVAAAALAPRNSRVVAVIGFGTQGAACLEATLAVLPEVSTIRLWSRRSPPPALAVKRLQARGYVVETTDDVSIAVRDAEIIITATPSRSALVQSTMLARACHISAMGADTTGKQELDPAILEAADVFADDLDQAFRLGECQHVPQLRSAVSELATALSPAASESTRAPWSVFDSTGMAIQDLALAALILERARERGLGTEIHLGG